MGADSLFGPIDPATDAGWVDAPPRKGFFTDTSVCIGCKACEVACKEWNGVPDDGFNLLGMSYDNTGGAERQLVAARRVHRAAGGAERARAGRAGRVRRAADRAVRERAVGCHRRRHDAAHRHRARTRPRRRPAGRRRDARSSSACRARDLPGRTDEAPRSDFRWLMMSNVCKHCTHAGCLDVCPTGALFRTEFGTVVVQDDICNGCGYCIAGLPVRRDRPAEGRRPGLEVHAVLRPARRRPDAGLRQGLPDRVDPVRRSRRAADAGRRSGSRRCTSRAWPRPGCTATSTDDGVGGDGAFFLLLDEPEVYGLPPDPVVPTKYLTKMWKRAGMAGLAMAAVAVASFIGGGA